MRHSSILTLACVAAMPFLFGADADDSTKPATSKEIAYHTYAETVDRVTVVVDSYPARLFQKEKYIPLQIAVGVDGKGPELAVSIDGFNLVDGEHVYAAAPASYLGKQPQIIRQMHDYGTYSPMQVGKDFRFYKRTQSRLYTPEGVGDDNVHLDRETYLIDNIYFLNPSEGLTGVLTLSFETKGMENPVEVRFKVPLKKDKHKQQQKDTDAKSEG
jgi:hypothetical protein